MALARNGRAAAIAFVVAAIISIGWWWLQGRPQAMVDAPSLSVPCVSYAPYRDSQTPFDGDLTIAPAQIDEDLRLLAGFTGCVRTYSSLKGLEAVPEIAARYGMKVMLGAWVGQEREKTAAELDSAVTLANRWPETVTTIVVGNEVLLRREMPASELIRLIDETRARTPRPLTYADVWEFWEKHPEVAAHVDWVTIHTLPYWEDDPVAIADAIPHVIAIQQRLQERFPGRPVGIGEAGWPSAGRMREGALPSAVNQARFVRELLVEAERRHIRVNLIEAFDQPWKRKLEGTVGGHWGLFDGNRRQKFPLTGPVCEDPLWAVHLGVALGLAALPMVFLVGAGARLHRAGWLAAALAAHATGTLLIVAVIDAVDSSRTIGDMAASGLQVLLAVTAAVIGAAALADRSGVWQRDDGAASLLAALARRQRPAVPWRPALFALVRLGVLFGAAAVTLTLVFDPRYEDFPVAVHAVPAIVFAGLAVAGRPSGRGGDHAEERLLAAVLAFGAAAVAVNEGMANHQALAWAAVSALLAAPAWLHRRSGGLIAAESVAGQAQRPQQGEQQPAGGQFRGV